MRKLERGERPPVGRREMQILDREAIPKLLDAATPSYRTLLAALARLLKAHKAEAFARGHAKPCDYLFASGLGTPLCCRNVSKGGLGTALERSGIPHLRFHDLRHTFASLLIAQGANVVFVSRQLGHASPDITLRVYSHLFDRAEHAQRTREAMEAQFGALLWPPVLGRARATRVRQRH